VSHGAFVVICFGRILGTWPERNLFIHLCRTADQPIDLVA